MSSTHVHIYSSNYINLEKMIYFNYSTKVDKIRDISHNTFIVSNINEALLILENICKDTFSKSKAAIKKKAIKLKLFQEKQLKIIKGKKTNLLQKIKDMETQIDNQSLMNDFSKLSL